MTQTSNADEERARAAEEQNKQAQEEARRQIDEENERRLQAQRDAVGKGEVTSTLPYTFQEAAKATEELNQPPNFSAEREREQESSSGQPGARNVNDTTLPESVQTPAREGEVVSPSQATTEPTP